MSLVLGIGLVVLVVGRLVWRNASYRFPWNVAEHDGSAFKVRGAADGGFELGRSPCIGVDTDPTLSFSLFRESRFTRLVRMIGLSREFRTPDRDFDDCIYINSSDRRIGDWLSEDSAG